MNKSNLHVLLVDDDEATIFIYKWLLDKKNVADWIQVADNGRQAIDYILKCYEHPDPLGYSKLPDLILLDINMPIMDGWEFLERFAELPKEITEKPIIICMLTTLDVEAAKTKLVNSKFIAGISSKPLTSQALDKILASIN